MRPRLAAPRDALFAALARRGPISATELAAILAVSVPTLHRMLGEAGAAVLSAGRARRTRHALRRPLRGRLAPLPIFIVDAFGRASHAAELALLEREGSHLDLSRLGWPVPESSRDGWWGGLPYPLYDMRPQGYLGRQLARAEHRRLAVAPDLETWHDDEILHVLAETGSDVSGNWILGERAFEHWQARKLDAGRYRPLPARGLAAAYARLAAQAVAEAVPGSSTAGEFPKFTAQRELAGSATPHVLVKFSGADDSPAVRRWSDLLVCEHLALLAAAAMREVPVAGSRVLAAAGRTLLEVERFDRHGAFGRSALVCLTTLDAALIGAGSADWRMLARRLAALGLLTEADVDRIDRAWWFGRLIANTDMHTGNLSFRPAGDATGLELAPLYDMVPMLYAPLPGGEVPARRFDPPLPLPGERAAWDAACAAALAFWRAAAADARISAAFRAECRGNAQALAGVAGRL